MPELQAWDITHLETAARDWTATAHNWETSFPSIHKAVVAPGGAVWEGAAAEAAQQSALADLVKVRGWADVLHESAAVARRGADTLYYAKQSVLNAVEDAQAAGYQVGEDLSVTPPPEAGVAGAAEAQVYAADIQERAAQLVAQDKEIAAKISTASAPLHSVTFADTPTTRAPDTSKFQPVDRTWKEGPDGSTPPPPKPPVEGLPPEGISPPVEGPLTEGPASRPSRAAKGGRSLYDEHGGEWRYFPGDERHNPHWDYKARPGPGSKWGNVGIGGLPPLKDTPDPSIISMPTPPPEAAPSPGPGLIPHISLPHIDLPPPTSGEGLLIDGGLLALLIICAPVGA